MQSGSTCRLLYEFCWRLRRRTDRGLAVWQVEGKERRAKRVAIRGKRCKEGIHAVVQQRLMELFPTPMDAFVFLGMVPCQLCCKYVFRDHPRCTHG